MSDVEPRDSGIDRRTLLVGGAMLVGVGALAPAVMGDEPNEDPPAALFAATFEDEVSESVADVVPIGGDDEVRVQSDKPIRHFADGATVAVMVAGRAGIDVEQLGDRGTVSARSVLPLVFGKKTTADVVASR